MPPCLALTTAERRGDCSTWQNQKHSGIRGDPLSEMMVHLGAIPMLHSSRESCYSGCSLACVQIDVTPQQKPDRLIPPPSLPFQLQRKGELPASRMRDQTITNTIRHSGPTWVLFRHARPSLRCPDLARPWVTFDQARADAPVQKRDHEREIIMNDLVTNTAIPSGNVSVTPGMDEAVPINAVHASGRTVDLAYLLRLRVEEAVHTRKAQKSGSSGFGVGSVTPHAVPGRVRRNERESPS